MNVFFVFEKAREREQSGGEGGGQRRISDNTLLSQRQRTTQVVAHSAPLLFSLLVERARTPPRPRFHTHGMKWALKFATKGKGAGGGGPDATGKSYQGSSSLGNNGGAAAAGENGPVGQGGFRSGSEGEALGEGGGYDGEESLEPGQERDSPTLTAPEAAANGGGEGSRGAGGSGGPPDHQQRGAEKYDRELGGEESSATYEGEEEAEGGDHNNGSSAPHFTVDSSGRRQQGGGEAEGEEMDYDDGDRRGAQDQQGVFEEDGDSQTDSLQASKNRMKSFEEDDPEAHLMGETDAEWDGERQ